MQPEWSPREEAQSAQGFQGKSLRYHTVHPDQTALTIEIMCALYAPTTPVLLNLAVDPPPAHHHQADGTDAF